MDSSLGSRKNGTGIADRSESYLLWFVYYFNLLFSFFLYSIEEVDNTPEKLPF